MRHFVVGDIHGCLVELLAKMDEIGFDREHDRLHALGDLIDRGPNNVEVLNLLQHPWFDSIMGNHEELMLGSDRYLHNINGGRWFYHLSVTEQDWCRDMVRDLPYAKTITTATGNRYGLVHAEPLGLDWDRFVTEVDRSLGARNHATWARERVRHTALAEMEGVTTVYMGHTPVKSPHQISNYRWIDTGCFATGIITIEELK
jgi:serine/threonine protein phosphatase 1